MSENLDELRLLLDRERTAKVICSQLNNFTELKPVLQTILRHVKSLTRCEAVAIRLHDEGDYPYYVYDGFSESFIEKENCLCQKDADGNGVPCPDGKGYLLECMCGNVIRGRFDPSLPFFTEGGSFWSNNTSALLASTGEEERQGRTRDTCNSSGYESVALIPIKSEGEPIGLVQLNDIKQGMFTKDLIEYMEMIAEQVGLAVQNALTHTRLKETLQEVRVLRGLLPICSKCKKIRDDRGDWHQLEAYLLDHSEAQLTHGFCPDCVRELLPDEGFDDNTGQGT